MNLRFLFLTGFFIIVSSGNSYSFSVNKSKTVIERYEALRYNRVSEFIKFSARQLESLSGSENEDWEKLSLMLLRKQMRKGIK